MFNPERKVRYDHFYGIMDPPGSTRGASYHYAKAGRMQVCTYTSIHGAGGGEGVLLFRGKCWDAQADVCAVGRSGEGSGGAGGEGGGIVAGVAVPDLL